MPFYIKRFYYRSALTMLCFGDNEDRHLDFSLGEDWNHLYDVDITITRIGYSDPGSTKPCSYLYDVDIKV
jgi:hypothetical protein